ncbi:MAG TPA: CHAT domain-containing protein [Saprospiraceae bacterium]|nr:CHAT domain-containing protein [Saprospiraceae bacterium]HMQ84356.1 CHAT domain-containing protein [Saprospiraceae bacterium]
MKKMLLLCQIVLLLGMSNVIGQNIPFEDSIAIKSILDRAKAAVLADEDQVLSEIMLDSVWEKLSVYELENTELHLIYWQTRAGLAYYRARLPEAVELFKKSALIAEQYYPVGDIRLAASYHNLGVMNMDMEQYDEALHWINKAIDLRREKLPPNAPLLAGSLNVLGAIYYQIQEFEQARHYMQQAEAIYRQYPSEGMNLSTVVMNLGNLDTDLGDYDRAIAYYSEALALRRSLLPPIHNRIARCLNLLGDAYQKAFRYSEAEAAYLEAIYQFEHVEYIDSSLLASAYEYYASLLAVTDRPQQAVEFQEKCQQIRLAQEWSSQMYLSTGYHSMAEMYYNIGDYKTSLAINSQALELLRDYFQTDLNSFTIEGTALRVKILVQLGRPQEALELSNALLMQVQASDKLLKKENYFIRQLYAARAWAELELARLNNNKSMLTQSLQDFQTFERLLLEDHYAYTRPGTQAAHFRQTRQVFEQAIAAHLYALDLTGEPRHLEKAFYLSEQSRALQLRQSAQRHLAWTEASVPVYLLEAERELYASIHIHETLKNEYLSERSEDEAEAQEQARQVHRLQNHIDSLYSQLDQLQLQFKAQYPDYFERKYGLQVATIAEIRQQLLKPGQLMIEYFVGENNIYAFILSEKSIQVQAIKKDFPLETWVQDLRQGLTAFHTDPSQAARYEPLARQYADAAYRLYSKLLGVLDLDELPEQIIVISDQHLNLIPFDALLKTQPEEATDWPQHDYLLKSHELSYAFSATLLQIMHQTQEASTLPTPYFIGFAPVFKGDTATLALHFGGLDNMRKDLQPLPWSGEELFRVAKLMKGQAFFGKDATTEAFMAQASQASIIHLATHAQADDQTGDRSFLAFANNTPDPDGYDLVLAKDLYALRLRADMVTLSACETGIGELQDGEGVISLSRAFAYAGAGSVIASLWAVNDAKTKDLMIGFYRYLQKGRTKSQAMRQIKLDVLAKNRGQAAHPFFWAGFVGFGNMDALPARY